MKHIFVVNATSGKGKAAEDFIPKAEQYLGEHPEIEGEVYITKFGGDAMQYVKKLASSGEEYRFYACGGDGTLYEVINGAYKYPNSQIAVVPLGSGNDFARILGEKEKLQDIDAQVNGTVTKFDLIKAGDRVAINQCSMGYDAEVCAYQSKTKKLPGVNGEFAYTISLFYCLIKKLNNHFTIEVDGKLVYEGPTLFGLCANSRWYGGGYMGAPKAIPDDGLLDCIVVEKDMSRLTIASLANDYKQGKHLTWDRTHFVRGKKMTIKSTKPAAVNVDGECRTVFESTFEILEAAANIVIPTTSDYLERKANGELK